MPHKIAMLGTGLISMFYTQTFHEVRGGDRVHIVAGRNAAKTQEFAQKWGIPHATTRLEEAITHPEVQVVVIGLPNNLHLETIRMAAEAGKAILCTKPLARNADEARQILDIVERAGVFHGYLEDLVYTPKTLGAIKSVEQGAIGRVLWARSRETHPGPHSDWFWDKNQSGGGAIVDLGCHCIEIARNFIGKDIRPLEVVCWSDTQVHPIEAEDSAVGLVRYANGAVGQFEVSWAFRGGMDLRDEVSGTEGTIWLNHWLRTGYEMFSAGGKSGYVAEKQESDKGWLFPVGDEVGSLGYRDMFNDMLNAMDEGRQPREDFYDGYVVNAIMDAAYKSAQSKQWEKVILDDWRGRDDVTADAHYTDFDADHYLVKEEMMPDGRKKIILKEKAGGKIVQRFQDAVTA